MNKNRKAVISSIFVHFSAIHIVSGYTQLVKKISSSNTKGGDCLENNKEIKALIRQHRLFQYEVAEAMGVSEGYLSTLLRRPLTEQRAQSIKEAVEKLANHHDS